MVGVSLAALAVVAPAPAPRPGPPRAPAAHPADTEEPEPVQSAGFAWFLPRVWGPETGARGQARGSHQNNRAFFLSSFLFQRARRSNSSTLIPNTSWNSSGDKCLFKQKGETRRG